MAAVYRRSRVRVRREGRGRRLEVDGTFASFWEPGRVATGSVWDALAAPLLALPPARRRRVLILGLGAGSAARLIRAMAPRAEIVGVEKNDQVLEVARRSFGLDALGVRVHCGDALAWLRLSRQRFDLVIDDVFVGTSDAVRKPEWMLDTGLALAARRLGRGGVLVSNSLDEATGVARVLGRLRPHRLELRVRDYDNRVFAASERSLSAPALRRSLAADARLRDTLPALRIRTLAETGAWAASSLP